MNGPEVVFIHGEGPEQWTQTDNIVLLMRVRPDGVRTPIVVCPEGEPPMLLAAPADNAGSLDILRGHQTLMAEHGQTAELRTFYTAAELRRLGHEFVAAQPPDRAEDAVYLGMLMGWLQARERGESHFNGRPITTTQAKATARRFAGGPPPGRG